MKRVERLILAIVLVNIFTYFCVVVYPSVSDFDYWLMRAALTSQLHGSVDIQSGAPGFYANTVVLSLMTNLGYEIIPSLPLQLLPLAMITLALYRKFVGGRGSYLPLGLAYVTSIGYPTAFTWVSHDIGLLLVMCCVLLVMIRQMHATPRVATSISILLILVSLNFVSYKLVFVALVFLLALSTSEVIRIHRRNLDNHSRPRSHVFTLAICGVVLVLVFNQFFYSSFLPIVRLASEALSLPGVERLLGQWLPSPGPLNAYVLRYPLDLKVAKTLWLALLICGLSIALASLVWMKVRESHLGVEDGALLAAMIAGGVLALLYSLIGYTDLGFLVLTGIACLGIMAHHRRGSVRRFVIISLAALLVLNVVIAEETVRQTFYAGHKYGVISESGVAMSRWYFQHRSQRVVSADVLSTGYMLLVATEAGEENTSRVGVISTEELMMLVGLKESAPRPTGQEGSLYVINLQESHFSLFGWEQFGSWSSVKSRISSNSKLGLVYDSGDYEIYSSG